MKRNYPLYPRDYNSDFVNFVDNHAKGYLYMTVSVFLISLGFIFNTFALGYTDNVTGAFFFFGFGIIGSLFLMTVTRKFGMVKQLLAKFWKPLVVIGILNGASALLWFYLLDLIGPSILSFLLRFTTIFMIVLGVSFLKERFTKLEMVGAALMIAGAFVISYTNGGLTQGISFAIILSLIFSAIQFLNKMYIKEIDPLVINTLRIVFTFVTISVWAIVTVKLHMPPFKAMGWLALASMSAGIIGFLLNFKALQIIDLSKTAVIQSLQPFVVVVYSFIILGSIPTGLQLLGGIVIVGGTLISAIARYRPKIIARFIPFG